MDTGRFDLRAVDGTRIAVWAHGTGSAVVTVHDSIADHATFDPLVSVLGEQMTTYVLSRRETTAPRGLSDGASRASEETS